MNTTLRIEEQSRIHVKEKSVASAEISKIGVSAIVVLAGLIACWATACLFAGSLRVGGPFGLIRNLVNAVIG